MSVINSQPLIGASGQAGYNLTKSLRFRSSASAYLNRTLGTPTNSKIWTYSGWVKRGSFASYGVLLSGGTSGSAYGEIYFDQPTSALIYFDNVSGAVIVTSAVYRDPSAWYHVVVSVDTTQATASNRVKIYVNGVQVTAFSSATYPTQNTNTAVNTSGYLAGLSALYAGSWMLYADQYLAEQYFIDGQALTPSSFGETSTTTGVWIPKKYTGTYGTNGFYLPFTDTTSTSTLGTDFSGNSNTWTVNNISLTAGTTYDSMNDVPTLTSATTANYCVLNPLDSLGGTVSNGNLQYSGLYSAGGVSQNGHPSRSTLKVPSSGKWYVEMTNLTIAGSGNSCMLGFTSSTQRITNSAFEGTLTPWIGVDASVFGNKITMQWNGVSGGTAVNTQLFAGYASGDIVNLAIDFSAGKIWVGKNGTYYNSGNPSAGTNETSTFTAGSLEWAVLGEYVASGDDANRSSAVANFGQRPFAHTPPTGFVALNTFNLPNSTIVAGNKQMDILTWTGTNSTGNRTFSGLNFQPDFVWGKARSSAFNNQLYDSVRGTNKSLISNSTAAEDGTNVSGYISSFNSDGFATTTGSSDNWYWNKLNDTYVVWNWKAGGTAVTNTAGTITSSVSANTTAGFSVVTYTGTGSAGTVGHGLGVAPAMFITKQRSAVGDFFTYHKSVGATAGLFLNLTDAATTNTYFNNTAPTSSVFSIGTASGLNANGVTAVTYCFAEVAGYSAFGSYTGNGSTDGTFVYTGFRPRFVLIKRTNAAEGWEMFDSARDTYNPEINVLEANVSSAEISSSTAAIDFLSNGFKQRNTRSATNGTSDTYIYACFAENPFKYANAR